MDVLYVGPYYQNDEWGNTSKAFARLLSQQSNVNLVLRPVWFANQTVQPIDIKDLQEYEFNKIKNFDVLIQHGLPSYLNYNGKFSKNIAVTSVDCRIDNTDWTTHLNFFDKVIVFSPFEKKLLRESGVKVPLGKFEFTPFYHIPHIQQLDVKFEGTKFYTTGSLDLKTGLREVIAAYLAAFTILDDVMLVVATNDSKNVEQEIKNIKQALGLFGNEKHYANIAIISSNHPYVINYLHKECDFFIDVSYNLRTNQNMLAAILNNSFPILLDTCQHLLGGQYSLTVESQKETSLYAQRPLPQLYTGHHTWRIPTIKDLSAKLELAHKNQLKSDHALLSKFKAEMSSKQNEWIQECIH